MKTKKESLVSFIHSLVEEHKEDINEEIKKLFSFIENKIFILRYPDSEDEALENLLES